MAIKHFPPPSGIKAPPLSFAARTGDLLFISGIPGFDENAYVPAAQFERRTLKSVLDEFLGVRAATIGLVDGLTDEFAARMGNLASGTMSVRALLYLSAGHERHHGALFRERYLPCIATTTSR